MSTLRLPALLAAPLCLLGAGESPAFGPDPGTTLSKTFRMSVDLELDDLSLVANGMDVTDMIGSFEVSFGSRLNVEVTDEYVSVNDGRPTKLRRTYDKAVNSVEMEYTSDFDSGSEGNDLETLLEGRTVIFEWDEDEEDYVVAFEGDEEDDELLEGLSEDMDLRRFLPEGEVEEGDEWNVDPYLLGPVLAPGGLLGFQADSESVEAQEILDQFMGADIEKVLRSLLDGEVVCTFEGMEEVDEVSVAVIKIAVEIDSSVDLVEFLETIIEELAEGADEDVSIDQAELAFELEGEGRLLWDLDAGHFDGFEANGDVSVTFELVASGEEEEAEILVEASGEIELGASHD